jgi:AAA+ ATPase superfamily predicted ATPase
LYQKIVTALINGAQTYESLCQTLEITQTGRVSQYLKELSFAGFITRELSWDIKSAADKPKLFKYRLSDNYLRFYLRYVEKNKSRIERNAYQFKSLDALPEWSIIMGLQFENLVLNNRPFIWKMLGLSANDIVVENPYFQNKTTLHAGCQIDYMIQTKFNTLYACEIKFSQNPIQKDVIDEVQKKIASIYLPKRFSLRPVLIHVNEINPSVIISDYFAAIINFEEIFTR